VERTWTAARGLLDGSLEELAKECGVSAAELSGAVRLLESAGHLERGLGRDGRFFVATPTVSVEDLAVDFELLELRVARERQMLDRLVRFADTRGCRRQNLLRYFGDADAPRGCEACESCKGSRAPEPEEIAVAPRARKTAAPPDAGEGPFDPQVFEKLRALRTELARETRVPPYVVFHDATLRELARALPRDEKSFLAVKGAGPGRWQRYGERVVAITAAAPPAGSASYPLAVPADLPPEVLAEETTPVVQEAEEQRPFPFAGEEHPGLEWLSTRPAPQGARSTGGDLWKLCASGATLADICLRLKKSAAEVASEIANGAQRGKTVDVARLLGAERVEAIRAAARGANGDVVVVRRRLNFPAALAEIRLALAASQSRR
jgi:hypothetical protein